MIKYVIEPSLVKPYVYRKPLLKVDENGEVQSEYRSNNLGTTIKSLTLLNLVAYDEKGNLISFEPLEYVNQFLLAHHLDDDKLESGQLSLALAHYFTFIIAHQEAWDEKYDYDTFDELLDEPRPTWDYFPRRKAERITYLYRESLKDLVLNQESEADRMARSTASAYMGGVIKFYKYHLRQGYKFNNPPFEHEVVQLHFKAGGTSMKGYMKKDIHTTDLRLNFPKSSRNQGTILESYRRDLKPLTNQEWAIVEGILTKSKRVIRHGKDETQMQSLPIEFCLAFMVARYSGMRREEVASLHLGQVVEPKKVIRNGKEEFEKPMLRIGIGAQYGSLTKTKEAGNKSRKTIIPSVIMQSLYDYSRSERYKKRLDKFKTYCDKQEEADNFALFEGDDAIDKNKEYLFITQTGVPMFTRLSDFTGRWVEVRNTVNHTKKLNNKMLGSMHNLRPTFAVTMFRKLLRKMTPDEALSIMSSLLGHEDYKTTLEYLKIAQDAPCGDEIYEDTLEYLGVFDDLTDITPEITMGNL